MEVLVIGDKPCGFFIDELAQYPVTTAVDHDFPAPVYDDEIELSRATIPTPRRVSPKKAWKRRGKRGRK